MKNFIITMMTALLISGCATYQEQGTVGGAIAGGALGALVGNALDCKGCALIGGAIGALAGGTAGARIGEHMDRQDRQRTASAIDRTPTGRTTTWRNPDTNVHYDVTPTRTYVNNQTNRYCREVTIGETTIGGKRKEVYGTACRQPDGAWKLQ